jgi:hypothetical protein
MFLRPPPRSLADLGLSCGPLPFLPGDQRRSLQTRKHRSSRSVATSLDDHLAVASDLTRLIWQHKLWWLVPLLVSLLLLAVLLVLEATPVGPLLYPLF